MDSMDLYKIDISNTEGEIRRLDAQISDCAKQEQQLYQRLKTAREDLDRKRRCSQSTSSLELDIARYERELAYASNRRNQLETNRNYATRKLEQLRQSYDHLSQVKEEKEQKKQQQRTAAAIAATVALGAVTAPQKAEPPRKQPSKKRHTARNIILFIFAFGLLSKFIPLEDSPVTATPSPSQGLVLAEQITPAATQKANDEVELTDWIGKPFSGVVAKYGNNYLTDWFRGAFVYYEENCPYNFYYNDNGSSDGLSDLDEIVIAVSTWETGTLVANGIRIGDSLETVNTSLGQELAPEYEDGDELILPCAAITQGNYESFLYFDETGERLVCVSSKLAS